MSDPDQKRLWSVIDRLLELEMRFEKPQTEVSRGVKLSKRERLVLMHIRRRGRVMRSDLLTKLYRNRIKAASLSDVVDALVRAGVVAEHRELARNGHIKTTYSVVPRVKEGDAG